MPLPIPLRPLRTIRAARSPRASPADNRFLASDLIRLLEDYLKPEEVADVYRAYLFGAEAHEGQLRSSGEPYIYHPIEVARILAEMRLDSRSLIAALLHDVIEDTATAKEQIAREFGDDVAELVDGVSKIEQIEFKTKEEAQAEYFRKMLMAMAQDIRVMLIKLADRLHNMRTLDYLPPDRRRRIAKETLEIYAPIANRLGMYQWYRELEDRGWITLYPMRHRALEKAMRRRQGNRKAIVQKIRHAIERQLEHEGIPARVTGREKHLYSIYQKMRTKRRGFNEVFDALGFRIIVDNVDTCYRVLGVVHNLYKPIPGRFKDYIAIPKANGYQSLHTVVFGPFGQPIEIQIRTEEMHRVAEVGVAAHWLFKTGGDGGGHTAHQAARQWLLELLDTQKRAGNPREFLEHLKVDLFPDEVYVFTPKGEIKKLPRGATALDFAYAVHSDLGNRCVGVRVNHAPAQLRTVLRNGDHVEVLTSHRARPNPAWLNFVVTGKARAAIRSHLKARQWKESVRLGKRLLKKALKQVGVKRVSAARKEKLLAATGLKRWDDLLADIGLGNRVATLVAHQLVPEDAAGQAKEQLEKPQPLVIHGTEGMLVHFAKCCRPIPNDDIVGYLTAGKGIVIHTADCPNIGGYRKQPEKWVDVQWEPGLEGAYAVNIRVDVVNKRGVLAGLATVIAEAGSNIENVSVLDRDGISTSISFTLEVKNRRHLAGILRDLRSQESVIRVQRAKG